MNPPEVVHGYVDVTDASIFYRESVPTRQDGATVLLLHGFPSGSHQFRRLMDALGNRHRLIALDYPGFGYTKAEPDYAYSFDRLAESLKEFVVKLGLNRFVAYVFDFGAPVGFRLALQHPEWIAGLIVQNGNAYDEGLSSAAREFIGLDPKQPSSEHAVRELMNLQGTRAQYEFGAGQVNRVAPDGWTLDQHFLELPGRKKAQVSLAFDYATNLDRYATWQDWLRRQQPATLVLWGANDPFFLEAGAWAYARDVPTAQVHLFNGGHFALEEHLPTMVPIIEEFLARTWHH